MESHVIPEGYFSVHINVRCVDTERPPGVNILVYRDIIEPQLYVEGLLAVHDE